MLDTGVQFDEASHEYTVHGKRVPGVTTVLRAALQFGGASPEVLQMAMERGTAVHKAVEFDIEGSLDVDRLDPRIVPYLDQWHLFLKATGFRATHSEQVVFSARYGFAGTLDLLGTFPNLKPSEVALVDLKTGSALPVTVGPQTAGYEQGARETLKIPADVYIRRYALHLRPDAWKLKPLHSQIDSSTFLSALHLWRWCRDNKLA